jgi:hypothetical protein
MLHEAVHKNIIICIFPFKCKRIPIDNPTGIDHNIGLEEAAMKLWMWSVLVFFLVLGVNELFVIPAWVFFVIILPLLIVGLVIVLFYYNFRESLQITNVPQYGYAPRLRDLDKIATYVEPLGFRKIDQFYLKAIPDSVTYVFKHEKEPFYFCVYHLGPKHACDIITRFENDYYLTTANTVDAGMTPRPPKSFLQIFANQPYQTMLSYHMESYRYISENGIRVFDISEGEFRYYFMKSYREHAAYMKKLFLWPVALIIRTITRPGKVYCRTIKEQYPNGIPRA